jgi:formylglycine-generating enzyme required for sulfatase activity
VRRTRLATTIVAAAAFAAVAACRGIIGYEEGTAKWGQMDMAGNVAEWVQDWWSSDLETCTDCARLDVGDERVIRGGDYESINETYLENASRDSDAPDNPYDGTGIRCVRDP